MKRRNFIKTSAIVLAGANLGLKHESKYFRKEFNNWALEINPKNKYFSGKDFVLCYFGNSKKLTQENAEVIMCFDSKIILTSNMRKKGIKERIIKNYYSYDYVILKGKKRKISSTVASIDRRKRGDEGATKTATFFCFPLFFSSESW